MFSVQLRNAGDGVWTSLTLPITVQLAQALAQTAKQRNLADEVRIEPAAPMPWPVVAGGLDLKV